MNLKKRIETLETKMKEYENNEIVIEWSPYFERYERYEIWIKEQKAKGIIVLKWID